MCTLYLSGHITFHSETCILLIILLDQYVSGDILLDAHSLSQQIESNSGSAVVGELAGRRSEQRRCAAMRGVSTMTPSAVGRTTGQAAVMLLRNTEQLLDLGYEENVRVIDLIRVELLHLSFCDEAALVPEPLLGQVLPTIVSYFLLGTSEMFLP